MSKLLMVDVAGTRLNSDEKAVFAEHKPAGICLFKRNIADRYQMAEFSAELREHCGQDLIIAVDQEGGGVVRALDVPYSPGNMLLGSADDIELTKQVAAATARGLKAMGINMNFAPVADVNNNALNPVIGDRSFGEEPKHVGKHVVAYIQGLQAEGVAATAKHFPGHGDTSVDSHHDLPILDFDLARLHSLELYPFKKAIAAGVSSIMSYHGFLAVLDDKNPATLSHKIMTGLLRDELGFDGLSITDALEMKAIAKTHSPAQAVVAALKAGVDMPLYDVHTGNIQTHIDIFEGIDKAIKNNDLDSTEIKRSQERIRRLAKRYPVDAQADLAWQSNDNELLNRVAKKAVVLLGELPELKEFKYIYAQNMVGGSASDNMTTPAQELAKALEQDYKLDKLAYDRQNIARSDLLNKTTNENVVFVSSSRLRMSQAEKEFSQALAKNAKSFLHIALWNPYHSEDLPKPALVSFGFSPWSINAVVETLKSGQASGTAPISLKTLETKS